MPGNKKYRCDESGGQRQQDIEYYLKPKKDPFDIFHMSLLLRIKGWRQIRIGAFKKRHYLFVKDDPFLSLLVIRQTFFNKLCVKTGIISAEEKRQQQQ